MSYLTAILNQTFSPSRTCISALRHTNLLNTYVCTIQLAALFHFREKLPKAQFNTSLGTLGSTAMCSILPDDYHFGNFCLVWQPSGVDFVLHCFELEGDHVAQGMTHDLKTIYRTWILIVKYKFCYCRASHINKAIHQFVTECTKN